MVSRDMDRASVPTQYSHLVPPLPTRKSKKPRSAVVVVRTTTSTPLPAPSSTFIVYQTTTRTESPPSSSPAGRGGGTRPPPADRRPLASLHRVAPRAVANDYRDVSSLNDVQSSKLPKPLPTTAVDDDVRRSDVVVELSPNGVPFSRTALRPLPTSTTTHNVDGRPKQQQQQQQQPATSIFDPDDDAGRKHHLVEVADDDDNESTPSCPTTVICPDCGKCQCAQCTSPATPPAAAARRTGCRRAVDVLSCVCCARRVLGRAAVDDDDGDGDDDVCGCRPAGCCRRWTLLVVLSACLPCLCLYWPLRCCASSCAGATARRGRRRRRGCRCRPPTVVAAKTSPYDLRQSDVAKLPLPSKKGNDDDDDGKKPSTTSRYDGDARN